MEYKRNGCISLTFMFVLTTVIVTCVIGDTCIEYNFDPYTNSSLPSNNSACDPLKRQLWLPLRHNYTMLRRIPITAYYIKVLVPNDGQSYRVEARSLGTASGVAGLLYGTREKCNDAANAERAVCLEIRPPAGAHCGILSHYDIDEDGTEIQVQVVSHSNMVVTQVNPEIMPSEILQGVGQTVFKMNMIQAVYGLVFGIYYGESDDSLDDARREALNNCKSSSDVAFTDPGLTDPNSFAVSFAGSSGSQQGAIGETGEVGLTGATGSSGPIGNTGASGSMGATGPHGATGSTGPSGGNGSSGATGAQGATGPIGPMGASGEKGANGKDSDGNYAMGVIAMLGFVLSLVTAAAVLISLVIVCMKLKYLEARLSEYDKPSALYENPGTAQPAAATEYDDLRVVCRKPSSDSTSKTDAFYDNI